MERRGGEERRDREKGWRDTHPYSLLNVHLHINVSAVRLPFSIRLLQHTSMISMHTHTHTLTHTPTHTHTHTHAIPPDGACCLLGKKEGGERRDREREGRGIERGRGKERGRERGRER